MKNFKQIQAEVYELQSSSKKQDYEMLLKKYALLKKHVEVLQLNRSQMEKQLNSYRKIVFQNADISTILEMQHSKILQLETQLEILHKKYDNIMSNSSSLIQTQYAIKYRELQKQIKQQQVNHQKQIASMRQKIMKLNANQFIEKKREIVTPHEMNQIKSPPTRGKKFV